MSKEYEEEDERMLTLEKFEQASEIVKDVTLPTKLVYSEYLSQQSGDVYKRQLWIWLISWKNLTRSTW